MSDLEICPECRWTLSLCKCPPPAASYLDTLRAALVDSEGLDSLPEPEFLIRGVLYLDSVAWLQGRPGSGKSFLALDIAACVAADEPWQGNVVEPVNVLYVVGEGTSGLRQRVRAWESAMSQELGEVLQFLPVAVQAMNGGDWDALIELAASEPYRLIVLDTQARLTVGMEENSAKDMGVFVRQLERLRAATGACVLVVHHQGRVGEHMRGSTAMEGAATTVIQVSKEDDLVTVKCLKQKDALPFDDIRLRLLPRDDSAILAVDDGKIAPSGPSNAAAKTSRDWFELHGREWVTASKLVDVVAPKSTFYRHVAELERAGFAEVDRAGRFTLYRLSSQAGASLD